MTPAVNHFNLAGYHRLIPSRFSEAGTVLAGIADGQRMLEDIALLDGATNDRIRGENEGLFGISTYELVYGIPNAQIVNGAFTHTNPDGCRFNDDTRGAWYAADQRETSLAEVVYHKARRLADIIVPELPGERPDKEVSTYDDWLADFRSEFHVLEPAAQFSKYLKAEPVPQCYSAPQQLARRLLKAKSNGIVYPSVRRTGHRCLACFRPALVYNPRHGVRLEVEFVAANRGYKHRARLVPGTL